MKQSHVRLKDIVANEQLTQSVPSSRKYEKSPEQGYLKGMFALLRRYSVSPIEDQLRLWDRIVFDCLIGNTDAHLKNFSLIYGRDGRGIRLSPAYDLVSTCVYESSTREMAFHIGGEYDIRKVSEDHFRTMAREVGLGEKMALRRLERIRKRFLSALKEASEDLQARGFERAGWLADRIREESGSRPLVSA